MIKQNYIQQKYIFCCFEPNRATSPNITFFESWRSVIEKSRNQSLISVPLPRYIKHFSNNVVVLIPSGDQYHTNSSKTYFLKNFLGGLVLGGKYERCTQYITSCMRYFKIQVYFKKVSHPLVFSFIFSFFFLVFRRYFPLKHQKTV